MKKALLIVILAVIVIAGSALWIWQATGITDAAVLVPENTVALVSLPDIPRTLLRWPKTTLAQIGAEPELKEFLKKPLTYLTEERGGEEASGILIKLKPGRIFAAVLSVSGTDTATVLGFQYWGGKVAHDAAIARLRLELADGGPLPTPKHEDYEGNEITSTTQYGLTLHNASHGQWGFLSNDLPALKATLDRAAGRVTENALANSPRYKAVKSRLLPEADVEIFIQPEYILDSLLAVGQSLGAEIIPRQVSQARKVEAFGGTMKLDGADLHDSFFVLRPAPPDVGTLSHKAIRFTNEKTSVYFDFVADLNQFAQLGSNPVLSGLAGMSGLENSALLEILPTAFGPECAIALSWPGRPQGLLAIEVKDRALAANFLQEALSLFPETTVNEGGGKLSYSFPALQSTFANPTLILTDDFLLIGLDSSSLDAVQQTTPTGNSLESTPTFSTVLPIYRSANEVFGYVDARGLFEQSYPMLRQIVSFSAAIMPGVSNVIDSSKLPNTATIAQHLNPIVYSQTRLPDGYLVESQGPITMNQALILGVLGGRPFLNPGSEE